jgi:hypothetical protein
MPHTHKLYNCSKVVQLRVRCQFRYISDQCASPVVMDGESFSGIHRDRGANAVSGSLYRRHSASPCFPFCTKHTTLTLGWFANFKFNPSLVIFKTHSLGDSCRPKIHEKPLIESIASTSKGQVPKSMECVEPSIFFRRTHNESQLVIRVVLRPQRVYFLICNTKLILQRVHTILNFEMRLNFTTNSMENCTR